jgi:hypothetical protein
LPNIIKALLLQVDFPAITICGSGRIDANLESGFYNLFQTFLRERNIEIPWSPIEFARQVQEVRLTTDISIDM